ncbi:MAG: Xaa-Pro peptidase family protein [Bacilli bacterium]|jgi:Xaa-Pro aminopeptidase|nr:Xaa-Pro peptidase family protein [Bacilli bacterium]
MIPSGEFENRRRKLIEAMDEDSILVSFGGVPKVSSADEEAPFEINRNFLYLSGISQEGSVLLLAKTMGETKEFLFILPFDESKEKWYGKRLSVEEARERSGIHNILMSESFEGKINGILNPAFQEFGDVRKIYLDRDREIKIAEATSTHEYEKTLLTVFPKLEVLDLYPLVTTLRLVKSDNEINELRSAISSTKLGIAAVMAKAKPGVKEYELADEFLHVINDDNGYEGLSFYTIMASGVHAACLHYPTPMDTVRPNSLLLMDLGARKNFYCADVSRTIPVSGRFTPEQAKVYSIVLGCNKMIAAMAQPGLTIEDLQNAAVEYLASECLAAGFISKKEDIIRYYFHSVSHFIGLDTHDPYLNPLDRQYKKVPLAPGMVISDEPGLYMKEKGLGVRVEDDLLITKGGCEVLTAAIPKEKADLERILTRR